MQSTRSAYILAGGAGSRLGGDKARVTLLGEAFVSRVAAMAGRCGCEVTVVADKTGRYTDLGLRTIADLQPGLGPLAGLEAALLDAKARKEDWVLLLSCDLFMLPVGWIKALDAARGDALRVIAFRDRFWQPLPALYHVLLLEQVRMCIQSGERSLQRLIDAVAHHELTLSDDWPELFQINTPADLERAVELLSATERRTTAPD